MFRMSVSQGVNLLIIKGFKKVPSRKQVPEMSGSGRNQEQQVLDYSDNETASGREQSLGSNAPHRGW